MGTDRQRRTMTTIQLRRATPEQALKAVQDYVRDNRFRQTVDRLLEDDEDYFAVCEIADGVEWLLGEGSVLVKKSTGEVWTMPMVYILDKVDAMRELP